MYYQVILSFIIKCHEIVENKGIDEHLTILNDIPNTTKDEFQIPPAPHIGTLVIFPGSVFCTIIILPSTWQEASDADQKTDRPRV